MVAKREVNVVDGEGLQGGMSNIVDVWGHKTEVDSQG